MGVKTYYWNTRKVRAFNYYRFKFLEPTRKVFRYGNAGDIFNVDLIKYLYGQEPINTTKQENRLLLVGSTASIIGKGDLVNGIGWKGNDQSKKAEIIESAKVYGVRGPLTKSLFETYGTDLTNLKFEYDPGLLIKEVYNLNIIKQATSENVIFIPHYKDVWAYKGKYPKGLKVVNIDNSPKTIAKEILNAKIVYASSLHGIIFSHALNKECVFVKPQSEEPIFKYEDYYLSIGLKLPNPIKDIYSINYRKDEGTLLPKQIGIHDFYFPDIDALEQSGIII